MKDKYWIFFIDFKSAYNSVNREILYEILIKKNILPANEVIFLKEIHNSIYFRIDNQYFYFNNGVH